MRGGLKGVLQCEGLGPDGGDGPGPGGFLGGFGGGGGGFFGLSAGVFGSV